jgi:hypothetical protein
VAIQKTPPSAGGALVKWGVAMNHNELDRAAYRAAYSVASTGVGDSELACPGTRHSHAIDCLAAIIKEVFEPLCNAEIAGRAARTEKVLPFRAENAAQK